MCFLISCCGWTIDLLQRFWTFVMSCFICWAVCSLLAVTTLAGVALGYNYSLAEYIDMKEGKNVSVYLKRGIFASDYIHYGLRGSKADRQTSTSVILITISRGSTTTTTTTTTVRPLTTLDKETSISEPNEIWIQSGRSSPFSNEQFKQMPNSLSLSTPSTPIYYGKTGKVPMYGFSKSKYETTTALNSISEDHDIKATSRTDFDVYWITNKERDKVIRNHDYSTLSPAIEIQYNIPSRSIAPKIDNDPFVKTAVPYLFYEKSSIDNAKPDMFPKKSNLLLFREAIKANNDMIQRPVTPSRDEEYEYDIQGVPFRKKRNMLLNKVIGKQEEYNETKLTEKTKFDDWKGWKTTFEQIAIQKILVKVQFEKEQFTSAEQTLNPEKVLKSVAETGHIFFRKVKHSTLKHIKDKTGSFSTEPIQRSHSKFLNILRNFNDDKK